MRYRPIDMPPPQLSGNPAEDITALKNYIEEMRDIINYNYAQSAKGAN